MAAAGRDFCFAQTAAAGVDRVPPDLQLSGDKTQNPQGAKSCDERHCDVIVEVSCGDEACTTRAKGRLTNVKNDKLSPDGPNVVAPGKTLKRTGPEMTTETQRKQVRKALRKGEKVQAKVTVRAKDAAGNVATAKRTIRLVRARVDSKVSAAAPEVVKYDRELTLTKDRGGNYHGW